MSKAIKATPTRNSLGKGLASLRTCYQALTSIPATLPRLRFYIKVPLIAPSLYWSALSLRLPIIGEVNGQGYLL